MRKTIAFLCLAIAGCTASPRPDWEGGVKVAGTPYVTLGDITKDPSAFQDKWVRIEGRVD